jgi:hypothetical protein
MRRGNEELETAGSRRRAQLKAGIVNVEVKG